MKDKGFPDKLEAIIRELWQLRLTKLHDRLPDDATDTDGESQFYSSHSEDDKTPQEAGLDDARLRRHGRNPTTTPSLMDAIALCYIGLVCLRVPVTLGDLTEWIERGELKYYRAISLIPKNMRTRLPATHRRMLEPEDTLKPAYLQKAVLDLSILYERVHGVTFPPLNTPPLLFRLLQTLALPIEVYAMVPRLAQLVGYTFDYSKAVSTRRYQRTDIPELQLASLIVIAVKLLCPFDEITRHPTHSSEPAGALIDWSVWIKSMRQYQPPDATSRLSDAESLLLKESDVYVMSDHDLDYYLDWYQRTWVNETLDVKNKDADFRTELFRPFPLDQEVSGITARCAISYRSQDRGY
ncbi:hypothetical protein EJ05DRAFT_473280 [Pseudovirgaria hyperparasitica]|uniref:Uncharacterized protein n=1 Tax=Pseudovirgaria hyperparasitica TaxID=470096 RepID=A0A6A6WHU4_9PEZI|nr:uncharacterized protein EJ05DRAFT_473280 [Pseudovirgaria hyperparasitica]KAF2762368.1 hypothetical protein EJ05DRAFT_473280 [Pseudovirgaria hyperparasitica]